MSVTDIKTLLDQILGGDYEGHESEIVGAVRTRSEVGAIQLGWRISWEDLDVTQENLTVGEAKLVEKLVGRSIHTCPPARDAATIAAYLTAAFVMRKDMSQTDAVAAVDNLSIRELVRSVSDYTIVDPPKDGGDQT